MNTELFSLIITILSLLFTALSTYLAFKDYRTNKRGSPAKRKSGHRKSNRQSLRKITIAFSIKVTKK